MSMLFTTLIHAEQLRQNLSDPNWVILDCRCLLADADYGRRQHAEAHIPGAQFADLNSDLAAPVVKGLTGRHPLPAVEFAAERFAAWGIGPGVQVVVYDDAGGALAAVRAWWMLRWLGHEAAAVLDGGWQRWQALQLPVSAGQEPRPAPGVFIARPRPELVLSTAEVDARRDDPAWRILDSRAAERYRGENETIDPVAGHIPGAVSAPYGVNLNPDGTFRPAEHLRRRFERLLDGVPAEQAVFYCGSGVTSILNILALQAAGLGEARLYPGSWSEWIADGTRPVATGEA